MVVGPARPSNGSKGIGSKVTIPTGDRDLALRSLNRMNINHRSLFPDLHGTSEFANVDLLIDDY
jgi:hypothetical protein